MDVELAGGEHGVGIGADGEEGRIAQVEQAGIADHDIQTECQQDPPPGILGNSDVALIPVDEREGNQQEE